MEIQLTAVVKIIEGAMDGDVTKVISYANHIAEQFKSCGEERAARMIRKRLDGSYKTEPTIVVLDENIGG